MSAAASTVERATTAAGRAEADREALDAELARFARQVVFHVGPWSVEEFLQLPEWGTRIELLDGSLLMSPGPAADHQEIELNLAILLRAALPKGWNVLHDMNLKMRGSTVLRPDVVVVSRRARVVMYQPADVALAVEIVSPSSKQTDREEKPGRYAKAGIEWFLRVEPKGSNAPKVYVYRLKDGAYVEHARAHAGEMLHLTEPFEVAFDPAVLLPPFE